jgi:hypothetical protein
MIDYFSSKVVFRQDTAPGPVSTDGDVMATGRGRLMHHSMLVPEELIA